MKKNQNCFNYSQLTLMLEMEAEKQQLKQELGLSDLEIEGYFEMFIDNYIDIRRTVNENC